LVSTLTNQDCEHGEVQKEIKSRECLALGPESVAVQFAAQEFVYEIRRTVILPFVLKGSETPSLTLG
jgi:hypothetical protein